MQQLLRIILRPLLIWLGNRFSSKPDKDKVFQSLSKLYKAILNGNHKRGLLLPINISSSRIIIFSDQHKGNGNAADDFANNEDSYIAALQYYLSQDFTFINLGDAEELWKFTATAVLPAHQASLQAEAQFEKANQYYRCFGNHDLLWKNKLDVQQQLQPIFGNRLKVTEGIVLRLQQPMQWDIFLTHGHQGDQLSDNNALSTWIVAHIWSPLQRYLKVNVNTPAKNYSLRDRHNRMMYDWSRLQQHLWLITGHTHQPVFASGKFSEQVAHQIDVEETAEELLPTYFNSGCCCYNDGDITGIEIDQGYIRLVKWHQSDTGHQRMILEEKLITSLLPSS